MCSVADMAVLRIACIECGDSGPILRPLYGGYTDYFRRLLSSCNDGSDAREIILDKYAAYDGDRLPQTMQELHVYHGIVLTGSKSSAFVSHSTCIVNGTLHRTILPGERDLVARLTQIDRTTISGYST